jgi:DNA-binding MarR family transcriptional regulator
VVSRQIAQLSTAGLIDRRPAPEDGRASLLRVSARGEKELARLRTRYLHFMADALGGWSAEKITHLTDLLMAMNQDLREALGPPVRCHAQPNGTANPRTESASPQHAG